ncbi:hypothetical protein EMWEY_00044230 [Eimeria maxima]|uniref:Transmembrane protein n=1 Tax=Eimeria maxima TaxID=5804 RepID=U6MBX3_EIMMA|nr:hypothetical protein EMWEY_00044230 [Eimeria maxima]CDJ61727.1 hypothetical protein EMWEY_00044230 [Eimeria maxima]
MLRLTAVAVKERLLKWKTWATGLSVGSSLVFFIRFDDSFMLLSPSKWYIVSLGSLQGVSLPVCAPLSVCRVFPLRLWRLIRLLDLFLFMLCLTSLRSTD